MAPPNVDDTDTATQSSSPRLPWWKKLAFSLIVVVLAFGVPEGLLILFDYPPPAKLYNTRPDIFWGLEANLDKKPFLHKELGTTFEVSTNKRSMRYADIPIGRQANTIRILALGDSTTFGWGVEQSQTYPAQLEALLSEQHPEAKIQVINGGVPGYTSFQGLYHYKQNAAAYRPDIILFGYIVQDARRTQITDKQQAIEAASAEFLKDNPLYAFRTVRLLSERYTLLRSYLHAKSDKVAEKDPTATTRVPLDDYRENILTFKRLTDESGGRLVLFGFPLEVVGYTKQHRELLKELAVELKLDHFDPSNVVFEEARKKTLYFDKDKGHPNADGCTLIATQLAEYLDREGIISSVVAQRQQETQ